MWSYFFDFKEYPEYAQSVPIIVFSLFFGIVLAAIIALFYKKVLGSFVRFLLKSGADAPDSAIRFDTTSYRNNIFVRIALLQGNVYKRVIRSVPPEGEEPKKLRDRSRYIDRTSYYIPEELTFRADNMFSKRGTTAVSAILGILIALVVAGLSLLIIPEIMTFLNNLMSL